MKKILIGELADGTSVYAEEATWEHMKAHPDVQIKHIKEALPLITDYNGQFFIGNVSLGYIVGKDRCVVTDRLFELPLPVKMATRKGRSGKTPVLFEEDGFEPVNTSLVTVGVCKDDDGLATLFTAFYGQLAPKEPWDKSIQDNPEALAESRTFWGNHALVVTKDMVED